MMNLLEIKKVISNNLNEIKERFGVKGLGIFGSYVIEAKRLNLAI